MSRRRSWLSTWHLPREGRGWLLATAILLAVSIARNINLLALLAYGMVALFLLNAVVAGRRLHRLRVTRRLPAGIHAGSPAAVEVRVECLTSRGCSAVVLEDVGPEHRVSWYVAALEGHGRQVCRGRVVLPQRGEYPWGPVIASAGEPFGLVRRRVAMTEAQRVIVLPCAGRVQRDLLRRRLRGADPRAERLRRVGWRHAAARADVHGVRNFRPGDSPRWIHWRTTARRGELMVREFEDVPGEDLAVVFDPSGPPGPAFEAAVSLAAGVCLEWGRKRGDRLVLAVAGPRGPILDGITAPEHVRALLEALAVVRPGRAVAEGVARAIGALPPTVAVLVVSAGPGPLAGALAGADRPVTHARADEMARLDWYQPPGDETCPPTAATRARPT